MEITSFYSFVKNILEKSGDLTLDGTDFNLYNSNLILQAFGFDKDINTIAMTLNVLPNVSKKAHYKYLYYSIPKQHKLGSFYSSNKAALQEQKTLDELVRAISYFYSCSQKDAHQAIIVFNAEERERLVTEYRRQNDSNK